ncbi:unnamed protein product [Peniophora sp. CBMAI 1063]|nr:unnamed protein product [Peniophora sp. CBMAI 1063]
MAPGNLLEPHNAPMSALNEMLSAPTDDDVILYHQVWRALRMGAESPARSPLPSNVALLITAFCNWVLPDRVLDEESIISCYSRDSRKAEKRWFTSAPLTNEDVARIAAIQLETVAKDQGWASLPGTASYSWFEVGLERPEGDLERDVRWTSHTNELRGQWPTMRSGLPHPAPVEEWREGDIVSVWVCAQYPAWSNTGKTGKLRFFKWFKPASAVEDQIASELYAKDKGVIESR